jgi:hypothetical protein
MVVAGMVLMNVGQWSGLVLLMVGTIFAMPMIFETIRLMRIPTLVKDESGDESRGRDA